MLGTAACVSGAKGREQQPVGAQTGELDRREGKINERCGRSVHRLEAAFTAHSSQLSTGGMNGRRTLFRVVVECANVRPRGELTAIK